MYPSSYDLAVVNGQIVAFCKTNDFTESVRRAVNDEMFWRDLLQKFSIKDLIQTEVTNRVPNEVRNIVPNIVNQQLDNYTRIQIPSHVAKNLAEQITGFLNNHVQMQNILENHSKKLNEDLYVSAKSTLDRLTNEEQYHSVTKSHLENMDKRYNSEIDIFKGISKGLLKSQENTFVDSLESMKNQVNKETENIRNIDNECKSLRAEITTMKWLAGSLFVVTGVSLISLFMKK